MSFFPSDFFQYSMWILPSPSNFYVMTHDLPFVQISGKHDELLQSNIGAYLQLIKLQQMQQGESHDNDNIDVSQSLQPFGRKSGRKSESYSFIRRSLSKTSDSNRSMHSASVGHAELELTVQPPDVERRGSHQWWFGHGKTVTKEDPEAYGMKNVDPDVSIFRLASLNKPEALILFVGSVAAIVGGVIFPVYGVLLSTVIKTFYEPPNQLRKDANFWASTFVVLGCGAFVTLTVQMFCFSVGGSKLVERVRRLTFEKVLQQEISWFDESRNSRFGNLHHLFNIESF